MHVNIVFRIKVQTQEQNKNIPQKKLFWLTPPPYENNTKEHLHQKQDNNVFVIYLGKYCVLYMLGFSLSALFLN